jgi:hypothetical protein
MNRKLIRGAGAALTAGLMMLPSTLAASAHDVHTFGRFTVALGWLHEPAYVGEENAVQVLVKDARGNPFTGISDKDLTVEVSLGSARLAAKPLVPTADPDTGLGIPGEYEYHFIPTAPGNYTFHIHGSVGGEAVDESVTAGDSTFDTVDDASSVEFPKVVPASSELDTKIDSVRTGLSQQLDADRSTAEGAARRDEYIGLAALALAVVLGGFGVLLGLRAGRR